MEHRVLFEKTAEKERLTARELTVMGLLAALLCVSSYISIQLPFSAVPFTAQTLVMNMIALLLKPRQACTSVAVWILLGAVGLPVFSGGRGGIGVIAGPTGGFILSYLLTVVLIGLVRGRTNKTWRSLLATIAVGIPVVYLIGLPWMRAVTGLDWKSVFVTGCLPFLAWDVVKCAAAVYIALPLYRVVNRGEK